MPESVSRFGECVDACGIARAERERLAAQAAAPMRALFAQLASGEVCEVDGRAVMSMPDLDESVRQSDSEWVEIAPAILGWIDVWQRLAPDLRTDKLRTLAARIAAGQDITPRLVEVAREQFEATIERIAHIKIGAIKSAICTTQIGWEFEKIVL